MAAEHAPARNWRAIHVHLSDIGLTEQFLCEQIVPAVTQRLASGTVAAAFFIRYWERGPHLRLRLRDAAADVVQDLVSAFTAAIGAYVNPHPPQASDFLPALVAEPGETAGAWIAEGAVLAEDYHPETARYGGPAALAVNEDLFCRSTQLAAHVIAATPGKVTARVAHALDLMLAAADAVTDTAAQRAEFFRRYVGFWAASDGEAPLDPSGARRLVEMRCDHREAGRSRPADGPARDPAGLWLAALRDADAAFQRLGESGRLLWPESDVIAATPEQILGARRLMMISQMHMLNNRLGLTPRQEVQLSTLLAQAMCEAA